MFERLEIVNRVLDEYFPSPPDGFLDHKDAFTLLVAVVLSAQCTDARINKITPELFSVADTPEKMAALSVEEVKHLIRSCGLVNRKAESLVMLSRKLVSDFQGLVPSKMEELELLPGVGHKTASVMMIQMFDTPAFPVDTHVFRLSRRWGLSRGGTVEKVEEDLKKRFAKSLWKRRHLQMIMFGRQYCTARGCDGTTCPMCRMLTSP